ncbi:hypothetical protein DK2_000039 [Bacillus phage DK2]|uniref:Uncharacterized protein n=1 Tax=Bacillus phage DK2 TaxID=2500809 RepID=A0A3T0IIY9_9CAUD|nr:hypothetical protein H3017_gp39 [Bacillus phage DK2]AZU99792.1 hypothetical protein DK2_000039 [Bacillus phage DK2]
MNINKVFPLENKFRLRKGKMLYPRTKPLFKRYLQIHYLIRKNSNPSN